MANISQINLPSGNTYDLRDKVTHVRLTWAEYQALVQVDSNKVYFITDKNIILYNGVQYGGEGSSGPTSYIINATQAQGGASFTVDSVVDNNGNTVSFDDMDLTASIYIKTQVYHTSGNVPVDYYKVTKMYDIRELGGGPVYFEATYSNKTSVSSGGVTQDVISTKTLSVGYVGNSWLSGTITTSYAPIRWIDVVSTLSTGSTSITLSNSAITTSSTIQVFTDLGVDYDSITVATGSVTLTFDAQSSDMNVKVRIT